MPPDLNRNDLAMKPWIVQGVRAAREVMAHGGAIGRRGGKGDIAMTMRPIMMIGIMRIRGKGITTMNGRFMRSSLRIRGELARDIEFEALTRLGWSLR